MSFLLSLILLGLILVVGFFIFTRASGLVRFFVGLAVFCVAVAFVVPLRHRVSLVLPSPFEEVIVAVEKFSLFGVNLLASVLRFFGGLFGIS